MIENGVHNISNEAYHASPGISRSSLWNIRKSPAHYQYAKNNKDFKMSPAMIIGDALHTSILEPQYIDERYIIAPAVDKRTKAGKAEYAEFLETVGSKSVLTEEQHLQVHDMSLSLMKNEYVEPLLNDCLIEQSIYFMHEPTGMQCKVRPDAWCGETVVDLKTTLDAGYRAFQSSCFKYGYYLQAAMISEGLKSIGIEMQKFVFICVENTKPYASAIYLLDSEALEYGVKLFNELMGQLQHHQETQEWPSYGVQVMQLPNYANYE